VDALRERDIADARATPPSEKLAQAIELMDTGIRLKRAAIQQASPNASEREIDEAIARWLLSDD
jgi:hypothetical protein